LRTAWALVVVAAIVGGCGSPSHSSVSHPSTSTSSKSTTTQQVSTTLKPTTTAPEPTGTVHASYRDTSGYTYRITATPPTQVTFSTPDAQPGNVVVGLGAGGVLTIRNTTAGGRDAAQPGTAYEIVLRFPGGCPPPGPNNEHFACSITDAGHGYSSVFFLAIVGSSDAIPANGQTSGPARSAINCQAGTDAEVPDSADRSVFYWRVTTPNSRFVSSDGGPVPAAVLRAGASFSEFPPFDALQC